MSVSAGQTLGEISLQASPIVLTGGIAPRALGGALPIIAITEGANFLDALLSGGNPVDLNNVFASFIVLPGATLADNQVGMYPFANQAVAANAIIAQPLAVSMLMRVPAKGNKGFAVKQATMTALQKTLQQHSLSGGTYTVITPSYIYSNCLLTAFADASGDDDTQQQVSWRMDFIQPLVSKAGAAAALNGLMQQLTNGSRISGTPVWSGYAQGVGNVAGLLTAGLAPSL